MANWQGPWVRRWASLLPPLPSPSWPQASAMPPSFSTPTGPLSSRKRLTATSSRGWAPRAEDFCQGLAGNRVLGVDRRGKYLLFPLEDGRHLIVHLRMTGVLLWDGGDVPYVSARFYLEGGHTLVFQDRRGLGALWLVADPNITVGGLGPE